MSESLTLLSSVRRLRASGGAWTGRQCACWSAPRRASAVAIRGSPTGRWGRLFPGLTKISQWPCPWIHYHG